MRLAIIDRDNKMLRRGWAVQRSGYETGIEAIGLGYAGRCPDAFDDGMILIEYGIRNLIVSNS